MVKSIRRCVTFLTCFIRGEGRKYAGNKVRLHRVMSPTRSPLTRHNSADSVPTSNLVCITEVAIRTTLCIAGII